MYVAKSYNNTHFNWLQTSTPQEMYLDRRTIYCDELCMTMIFFNIDFQQTFYCFSATKHQNLGDAVNFYASCHNKVATERK